MARPDIVICKEEEFLLYRAGKEEPEHLTVKSIEQLNPGYILVLPDSVVTLIHTEIEPTKKRRLHEMVRLYIEGMFPDRTLSEDDFGFVATSPVIACLYSSRFKEATRRLNGLFTKASMVTVPSLLAIKAINGTFMFKTEKTCLIKERDGFVHIHGEVEGYDNSAINQSIDLAEKGYDYLVELIDRLYDSKELKQIDLKRVVAEEKKPVFAVIKRDLLFWGVVYLLLIASIVLKIAPYKRELKAYEEAINRVYMEAGVAKEADPYGMLLFKVNRLKKNMSSSLEPVRILYALTRAFEQRGTIESVNLGNELLKIKGKAKSLEDLDGAVNTLSRLLDLEFKTESAKVKKKTVEFVVTGRINK